MSIHIDVGSIDWHGNRRVLGARVYPLDDNIKIDPQGADDWEIVVRRSYVDEDTGEKLSPQQSIKFLEKLHVVISSDYSFCTGLHDDDTCPFRENVSPFVEVPVGRAQRDSIQ